MHAKKITLAARLSELAALLGEPPAPRGQLTLHVAAAALGCSKRTLQRLLRTLPAARSTGGGRGKLTTVAAAALPALSDVLDARRRDRAARAAIGRIAAAKRRADALAAGAAAPAPAPAPAPAVPSALAALL